MPDTTRLHLAYRSRLDRLRNVTVARVLQADGPQDVVPMVLESQRQAVTNADAYLSLEAGLATSTDTEPWGIDPEPLIGAAARRGRSLEDVYGANWSTAAGTFTGRIAREVNTDLTLADRAATFVHTEGDSRIVGSRRVLGGGPNCGLCVAAATRTYRKSELRPIHHHCVIGETLVSGPARQVTRRWDQGEAVVIRTAAGNQLTVTPNHPILTTTGWVAAGELRQGMDLLRRIDRHRPVGGVPDKGDVPTCIEDRFRTGSVRGLVSVPFATEDFHGDGGDGDVDVVLVDRHLGQGMLADRVEPAHELSLSVARGNRSQLPTLCPTHQFIVRSLGASNRRMRSRDLGAPSVRAELRHLDGGGLGWPTCSYAGLRQSATYDSTGHAKRLGETQFGLARSIAVYQGQIDLNPLAPTWYPTLGQRSDQDTLADADDGRRLLRRVAGQVSPDRVLDLCRVSGPHWVYNLHTPDGWYYASDLIVHNCGCTTQPVYLGDRSLRWSKPTNDTLAALYRRAGGTSGADLSHIVVDAAELPPGVQAASLPSVVVVESELGPTLIQEAAA